MIQEVTQEQKEMFINMGKAKFLVDTFNRKSKDDRSGFYDDIEEFISLQEEEVGKFMREFL